MCGGTNREWLGCERLHVQEGRTVLNVLMKEPIKSNRPCDIQRVSCVKYTTNATVCSPWMRPPRLGRKSPPVGTAML